jgi:hypothetical protein
MVPVQPFLRSFYSADPFLRPNVHIGPLFFEQAGKAVTVPSARYRKMLEESLAPELHRLQTPPNIVWFEQDGATMHSVLVFLQGVFPEKVISKSGTVEWTPRSPNLSLADFFLWGHLKAQVYREHLRSLRQLKQRIRAAVGTVSDEMLQAVLWESCR